MGIMKRSFGWKDSASTGIIQGSLYLYGFLSLILCATFSSFFLTPRHHDLFFFFVLSLSLLIFVHHLNRRCACKCNDEGFQTISFSLIWAKLTTHDDRRGGGRGSGKISETKEQEGSELTLSLRRKLRRERKKRKEAIAELEREREASAWAWQEAMAKIMSLEGDKACVEREARQYRQMVEKQQLHYEEVIHHLQLLLLTPTDDATVDQDHDDATWPSDRI